MKKLIIIPAFNEELSIQSVVHRIKSSCSDYDYVIINDCSTDNTKRICEQNQLNVINLPINLGIGGAMQTGYKYAYENDYDFAVQIDGDGQHIPDYVAALEAYLVETGSNMVIGSRFLKLTDGFKSTKLRRIGISFFSWLIAKITGVLITDPTSGFRLVDKSLISEFASEYPSDYPEPESVAFAIRKGYDIREVSVKMEERQGGVSSIRKLKSIYYMVKVTLAMLVVYLTNFKGKGD